MCYHPYCMGGVEMYRITWYGKIIRTEKSTVYMSPVLCHCIIVICKPTWCPGICGYVLWDKQSKFWVYLTLVHMERGNCGSSEALMKLWHWMIIEINILHENTKWCRVIKERGGLEKNSVEGLNPRLWMKSTYLSLSSDCLDAIKQGNLLFYHQYLCECVCGA